MGGGVEGGETLVLVLVVTGVICNVHVVTLVDLGKFRSIVVDLTATIRYSIYTVYVSDVYPCLFLQRTIAVISLNVIAFKVSIFEN